MLATAASCLSSSDNWRHKDDKMKKTSLLENWRDRRGSKETKEANASGETKETSGNWRCRAQEKGKNVDDEAGVYGRCIPSEWKLQKMYKQLKIDNNNFITWLVESVHPCSDALPPYVTLSRKQSKDHPKYEIVVNNFTELARQIETVSPTTTALLDRLIDERTEYSHWMARKSTDQLSGISNDSHKYYIGVLKEVRTILAERRRTESHNNNAPTPPSPPADPPAQVDNNDNIALGKRKNSSSTSGTPGAEDRSTKAAKTVVSSSDDDATAKPMHVLRKKATEAAARRQQQRQQQEEWRNAVAKNCDNSIADNNKCAPAAVGKPMSYAAALRVAIVA